MPRSSAKAASRPSRRAEPDFLLPIATLRKDGGLKWKQYGPKVLPAWVADMDFSAPPPVLRRIEQIVGTGHYRYAHVAEKLGQAFAGRMNSRFGWKPDPRNVVPVTDLVQAITATLVGFSKPGDGVLLQTPIYPPFLKCIANTGRRLVDCPLADDGKRHYVDEAALRKAVDKRTRILMLCNPHNPSGRVLTRAELTAVARVAEEHDLIVVADEIHCDLIFEGSHIPFATLGNDVAARTVTITSATKAFNIPGLRTGLMHFGSAALLDRFRETIPDRLLGQPSTLGIEATVTAWREGQGWLDRVLPYLRANRDHVAARLQREMPEIGYRPPQGTYLAWLDCRKLGLKPSPFQFFLEKARVGLNPGIDFGAAYNGYVRLNLGTSAAILDQILDRMIGALRKRG